MINILVKDYRVREFYKDQRTLAKDLNKICIFETNIFVSNLITCNNAGIYI
jgi:hypothetical protein